MSSFTKKLKALSLAAAFAFLLATTLLAAHSHASAKGEKEHSCSICQISHSSGKSILGSERLSFHKPEFARLLKVAEIHFDGLKSPSLLFIRGPPASS